MAEDLIRLREDYETTLDELESKRAAYRDALTARVAEGASYSELATETGLTEQRVAAQRPPQPILWRRIVVRFAIALLPAAIGITILYGPWTSFRMDMTVYLKEGATRADADQVVKALSRVAEVQEESFQPAAESPKRFTLLQNLFSFPRVGRRPVRALGPTSAQLSLHFPMQRSVLNLRENILIRLKAQNPKEWNQIGLVVSELKDVLVVEIRSFEYDRLWGERNITGWVFTAITPALWGLLLIGRLINWVRPNGSSSTEPAPSAA